MPDWIAHLMLAMIASTCLRITGERRVIFFIGNLMPDFLRFFIIFAQIIDLDAFYNFIASAINAGSHNFIGLVVYALFISAFFEPVVDIDKQGGLAASIGGKMARAKAWWHDATRKPFFLLLLGGVAHLLLDTGMWPYGGGITWLYPLQHATLVWSFKLWWPSSFDAMIQLAPFFAAAIIAELVVLLIKKHRT